jgi:hypothetical protein
VPVVVKYFTSRTQDLASKTQDFENLSPSGYILSLQDEILSTFEARSSDFEARSLVIGASSLHGPQRLQSTFSTSVMWEINGNHFLRLLSLHKKCEQKNLTHSFKDTIFLCTILVTSGCQLT